jgi:hypothetical protein
VGESLALTEQRLGFLISQFALQVAIGEVPRLALQPRQTVLLLLGRLLGLAFGLPVRTPLAPDLFGAGEHRPLVGGAGRLDA